MTALTDFLLARIAEDEAQTAPIPIGVHFSWERMSSECDAKRRIVDEHAMWQPTGYRYTNGKQIDVCSADEQHFPCRTLRFLALPYADHPDYDEKWRL